jgi:uncharacterized damage-inducible protein DinB
MYINLQDFLNDWQTESQLTISLFSKIEDSKKSIKINDHLRSLGRLAWHITQTMTEMLTRSGIFEKDVLEGQPVPKTMEEITEVYSRYSTELSIMLEQKWAGSDLNEEINMYGEMWEKRKILAVVIKHQIHHRGQMTAIMRMLEMQVPGLYGPAREEWAQFGMEAQE